MSDSSASDIISFWEEIALTGSTVSKGSASNELGGAYANGTGGKKRNLKKALKYYKKAAELGNAWAQVTIANMYHYGEFRGLPIPKSPEKAMDMVQRAVDHGHPRAQSMLGYWLSKQYYSDMDASEEANRLYTLSAYQGDISGIMQQCVFYDKQFDNLEGDKEITECLLLRLYWSGRLCIHEYNTQSDKASHMRRFNDQFQIVLATVWHKRPSFDLDPFTGYSHIPFLTSIYSMLRQGTHDKKFTNAEQEDFLKISVWKHICANCGKQRDKECVLKACARCKVFSYCSKECQVKHWKAGHKADCKGHHWIESYFPNIRTP